MQSSGNSWEATGSSTSRLATPPRSRFSLSGPSVRIDPRIDAVRRDLADIRLAARVFAPHYASAVRRFAGMGVALRYGTHADAHMVSEVLAGEAFDVLERTSTHYWGVSPVDGAVGYVDCRSFVSEMAATHVVCRRSASILSHPGGSAIGQLHMGDRVVATMGGDHAEVDGGYVPLESLSPVDDLAADPAHWAEAMLGAPVIAGGRSGRGVDAGGLAFLSFDLAGIRIPRFADLQTAAGDPVTREDVRRGDLAVWADHVAVMVDTGHAIHAGKSLVERIALDSVADHGAPVGFRRFA